MGVFARPASIAGQCNDADFKAQAHASASSDMVKSSQSPRRILHAQNDRRRYQQFEVIALIKELRVRTYRRGGTSYSF